MDNVVCQSRMRGLLLEQFFEYRSRLKSPKVGFVRGIFRSCDRQGIEDLRLVIFWIPRRDFRHGVAIGNQTRSLRRALVVAVQLAYGPEIRPFPLRLYACGLAAFRTLPSRLPLAFVFP